VIRGLEKVGLIREHKTTAVLIPNMATDDQVRAAVAKHEQDRWIGHDKDARNHHNVCDAGGEFYNVSFERWVPRT
jgi:hypothetical protein